MIKIGREEGVKGYFKVIIIYINSYKKNLYQYLFLKKTNLEADGILGKIMCLPPPHPILRGGAHAPCPVINISYSNKGKILSGNGVRRGSIGREGQVM